eukprot:9480211-Pyramimonas_sp.AAC.1
MGNASVMGGGGFRWASCPWPLFTLVQRLRNRSRNCPALQLLAKTLPTFSQVSVRFKWFRGRIRWSRGDCCQMTPWILAGPEDVLAGAMQHHSAAA